MPTVPAPYLGELQELLRQELDGIKGTLFNITNRLHILDGKISALQTGTPAPGPGTPPADGGVQIEIRDILQRIYEELK